MHTLKGRGDHLISKCRDMYPFDPKSIRYSENKYVT